MKTIIKYIKNFFAECKRKRAYKKRIAELRKKDPFIYK